MNIYFCPKSVGDVYLRNLSQPLLKDGVVMNTKELLWWLEFRMGITRIFKDIEYECAVYDYCKQHPVNELIMCFKEDYKIPKKKVFYWSRSLNSDDEVKLMTDASMVLNLEGPDTATFYGLLKAVIGIEEIYSSCYKERAFVSDLNLRFAQVYDAVYDRRPDCSNVVIYLPCKLRKTDHYTKKLLMLLRDACGVQLERKKWDSLPMCKEAGAKGYFYLNGVRQLLAASVKKVGQLIAASVKKVGQLIAASVKKVGQLIAASAEKKKGNDKAEDVTSLDYLLQPFAGAEDGDYKVPPLKVRFSPAEYFLTKIGERYPMTGGWGYDAGSAVEILMENMSRRIWFEYWFIDFRSRLELKALGNKAKKLNVIKCNVVNQSLRVINGKIYDVLTYMVEAYCDPDSYYWDLLWTNGEIGHSKLRALQDELDKENIRRRKSYNRMLHTKKKGERIGKLLSVGEEAKNNKFCYQTECFFDVSEFFGSKVVEESLI